MLGVLFAFCSAFLPNSPSSFIPRFSSLLQPVYGKATAHDEAGLEMLIQIGAVETSKA
jgi:hypothetical protein